MHVNSLRCIALLGGAAIVLGACNKGTSPAAGADAEAGNSTSSPPASSSSSDDSTITHIACDKIFKPSDVASVLKGNITINVYPYRSNACEFSSDAGPTIQLYSGNGDTEQLEWNDASANAQGRYSSLPGFGDQAFRRSDGSGSNETQVKKGDYYCAVTGGGQPNGEAVAKTFAALCDKVFAAR
jgi:hypothetical protein